MPRKKRKQSKSRSRFTGVRVLPALEALAVANIWSEAAFKTNIAEFATGIVGGNFRPGTDGGQVITLPELIGAGPGGVGGNYGTYATGFADAVQKNLGGWSGLIETTVKTAGVSIGFRVANKMTRRVRTMVNNQLIKPLGMYGMVRL